MSHPPQRIPRSAVEGILWPSLANPHAAQILALLYQLEQSQWWSPEQLRSLQLRQLQPLLQHAYRTVPFYRDRLDQAGFDPQRILTPERWAQLPLLTRPQIQAAGAALRSQQVPKSHGKVRSTQTSGSMGQPIKVYCTALNGLFWQVFTLRDHLWHRRNFSNKLATIRFGAQGSTVGSPPHGREYPSWGVPASLLYATGPSASLNISTDLSLQAAWLQRQNPHYLLTYPSNLMALTEYFQAHNLSLSHLKQVRTISEMLTPEVRHRCQQVWGVSLVDVYSSQEVGNIALQCPDCDQYHIQAEGVLVEILDEAGNPCPPGQVGRVVVTNLHNYAMPLLRYEIQDYAIPAAPCGCGRGLPTLAQIVGRRRNMVTLPNGDRRWPTGFLACADIAPIRQFQFVQTRLDCIEARLVMDRALTESEMQQFTDTLHQTLGYPFQLQFTYPDAIPRRPNGKFEEFMSEL